MQAERGVKVNGEGQNQPDAKQPKKMGPRHEVTAEISQRLAVMVCGFCSEEDFQGADEMYDNKPDDGDAG